MTQATSYASGIFTTDGPRYPFGSMVRSYGSGALGEVRVMKSPSGMTVSPLPANYAAVPAASPSPSLLTPRNALIAAGVVGLAAIGYVVLGKKKSYASNARRKHPGSFWFRKGEKLKLRDTTRTTHALKHTAVTVTSLDEGRGGPEAGWDVYDGVDSSGNEVSFYGFDVERRVGRPKRSQ